MSALVSGRKYVSGVFDMSGAGTLSEQVDVPGGSVAVNGNHIVGIIGCTAFRTFTAAQDAAGTTYTVVGNVALADPPKRFVCVVGSVAASNAGQDFAIQLSGNDGDPGFVAVMEIQGLAASQASAQIVADDFLSTTGAHSSGNLTSATGAFDAVFGVSMHTPGDWTAPGSFTDEAGVANNTHFGYAFNTAGIQNYTMTSVESEASATAIIKLIGAASGMLRPSASIGAGGMSNMTGGMQGKQASRNRIVVPPNYFAHRAARDARSFLRV